MGKTKRKWVVLDYSDPDALRAEDIPYDGSDSIKVKLDALSGAAVGDFVDLTTNQSVSGEKTFADELTINNALVQGFGSTATGLFAHAEGQETSALGDYSHAEGFSTESVGLYSHVEGRLTDTTGDYSHAEGNQTDADGYASHAEGDESRAVGDYSHAEGFQTVAGNIGSVGDGDYSHAEGLFSKCWDLGSHAEGRQTNAYGRESHAEGYQTSTSGIRSHAEGRGTITNQSYQHTGGEYNEVDVNVTSAYFPYIVGNGLSDSDRSDAFNVRMTGEIKHGGRPSGHVNGSHFGITHFGALSAAPTAYIEGDKYYDSVLLTEKIWNGSTWTSIGGVVGNGNAAGNILKFNEYLNNTCCNTVRSFGYITNDKKIRVIGFGLNKRFNAQNSSTYFPGIELQLPPEENEIPSKLYIQFTERVWVLCESGNVYAAGLNTRGEFSYEDSTILTDNPVLKKSSVTNVKKMTFGEAECYSAYYLTNAGELYCAGHNQFGQIGDGTTTTTGAAGAKLTLGPGNTYGNSTLEVTDVIAIGGFDGANHYGSVCAILSDGTVRTVGYGGRGQMGNGTNTAANTSWINPSLSGITKVGTTGYDSTTSFYALDADDTLHGWGDNDGYHLNTGGTADVLSPSAVTSGVSNFWAPNGTQALYVKDTSGDIYAIGKNANGELGLGVGAATTITTLTEVTSLSAYDVSEIVTTGTNIAGTMTNFVVTTDNKILVAGHNLQGQTGRITAENKLEEFELVKSTLNNSNYVSIKSGFNKDAPYLSNQYLQSLGGWSHILDDNSYVHGAGYNYLGVLGRDPAENLQFFSFTKIDYT